ncbi:MAG: TRIC cation channel family protein [Burkholderiaceae bacterium]|nr:TRIC cation channel family protein [Burkholderiaceae bacterium]MCD8517776.1 TRIC cation channel family protein [Burkholderiaceae bacterium]MCD8537456.1 TRIC cation channel family protein [Burkholderiaceae bacterium]
MSIDLVTQVLAIMATVAYAVTGVMAVAEKRVDLFSAVVLGVIASVGGGTVRDVIMDVPVFWSQDLLLIRVAVAASIVTFFTMNYLSHPQIYKAFLYIDGIGAAMFGLAGAMKAYELGFAWPLGVLIIGVISAIGGGLIRDVLTGRKTLLMSNEVYAVPVAIGCVLMAAILHFYPALKSEALLVGTLVAFALRTAAIYWDLTLPAWFTTQKK